MILLNGKQIEENELGKIAANRKEKRISGSDWDKIKSLAQRNARLFPYL